MFFGPFPYSYFLTKTRPVKFLEIHVNITTSHPSWIVMRSNEIVSTSLPFRVRQKMINWYNTWNHFVNDCCKLHILLFIIALQITDQVKAIEDISSVITDGTFGTVDILVTIVCQCSICHWNCIYTFYIGRDTLRIHLSMNHNLP